jgi:putative phage-type endonuclease
LKPGIKMKVMKNRKEWLENRKRIGGSDAAAIIGQNPYKSNVELWKEKTEQIVPEDISEKPYVKYGTEAEGFLRELFKLDYPDYKVEYVENNSFENERLPFAQASLDGWLYDKDGRFGILEIKTTNIMQSQQKEKWNERIPDNYYCQVLHYMAVLEADFAVLKAQLKYDFSESVYLQTRHYKIEREDVEDDIAYLMQKEKEFWEKVETGKRPALLLPEI